MNVGYVHTLETPDNAVDRGTLRVSVIDRDGGFLYSRPGVSAGGVRHG